MLAESSEWPLVTEVVLLCVLVLNEAIVFLINRVVSQVHVLIVFVDLLGVSLRGKPGQTFLENIDFERFVACDEDVDTEVKLVSINQ